MGWNTSPLSASGETNRFASSESNSATQGRARQATTESMSTCRLADMAVSRDDVNAFWDRQDWSLSFPKEGSLSNCVYCFLKGMANLRSVHDQMEKEKQTEVSGIRLVA